jgi:hypothetical protein
MNNIETSVDGATKGMRWTARIIGIPNGLVWLSQVPGIMDHSSIPLPISLQVALLVTPLLGVIIAWRWEQIGGAILIVCALLFWTLPQIAEGRVPMLTTGDWILLPGLLAGTLFLICRSRTKPKGPATSISNNGNGELYSDKPA